MPKLGIADNRPASVSDVCRTVCSAGIKNTPQLMNRKAHDVAATLTANVNQGRAAGSVALRQLPLFGPPEFWPATSLIGKLGIGAGDGVLGSDGISDAGRPCRSLAGGPFSRPP